jgi:hypothetical protein
VVNLISVLCFPACSPPYIKNHDSQGKALSLRFLSNAKKMFKKNCAFLLSKTGGKPIQIKNTTVFHPSGRMKTSVVFH